MTGRVILWASALLLAFHANAQESSSEWFLNANINHSYPRGGSRNPFIPVGYNKTATPKFLLRVSAQALSCFNGYLLISILKYTDTCPK